jgi:hypothetical protein
MLRADNLQPGCSLPAFSCSVAAGGLPVPIIVHPERPGRAASVPGARRVRQPGGEGHEGRGAAGGAGWGSGRVLQFFWKSGVSRLHQGAPQPRLHDSIRSPHM